MGHNADGVFPILLFVGHLGWPVMPIGSPIHSALCPIYAVFILFQWGQNCTVAIEFLDGGAPCCQFLENVVRSLVAVQTSCQESAYMLSNTEACG